MASDSLPHGYHFADAPPSLSTYSSLRQVLNLAPRSPQQAEGALTNSWTFITVVHDPSSEIVAMVRAIGDGGWYFMLADLCVLPAHRHQGIGAALLQRVIGKIQFNAPPRSLITISAGEKDRTLYARCGFSESAPISIQMWLRKDADAPPLRVPDGYHFVDGAPELEAYRDLRQGSGLTPKTVDQATGALRGSWAWCTVVHQPSDQEGEPELVGMIRAFGDGGWYFVLSDMAVLPAHRRKGLGDAALRRLVQKIREQAPPDALISLSADEMGRGLYKRFGFEETAPAYVGMWLGPGDVLEAAESR